MSTWTHVSGCIRLNDLSFLLGERITKEGIEKILGKISTFEKPLKNCKLPCGSEGSMEYAIREDEDTSSIARFDIAFFGDLRDYSDVEEIKKYFNSLNKKFSKKALMIRDGVIKIETEYCKPLILSWNYDTEKFERVGE